jgi:hypothetical protein
LAEKFKIKNLIYIISSKDKNKIKEIDRLFKEKIPNCLVKYETAEIGDLKKLENIIIDYKEALINLSGGEIINSLLLLKLSSELNIQSIYVDLANKRRYIFQENYRVIKKALSGMTIEEVIKSAGSNITQDSSDLCSKKEIVEITNIILNNLPIWYKNKQKLYDNNTFIHNYKDPSKVIVNKGVLNDEEFQLVEKSLKYFKRIEGLEYHEEGQNIVVEFKNNYLKGFLFKSGTWLEVVTHLAMKRIEEIDETRSGVVFNWSKEAVEIRNELDVVSIKDSILICISCKDSEKYDEDALNELKVYSERLGGENAIKILVATKPPVKELIAHRAKEMGINLVIIDKDISKFKNRLVEIINKDGQ